MTPLQQAIEEIKKLKVTMPGPRADSFNDGISSCVKRLESMLGEEKGEIERLQTENAELKEKHFSADDLRQIQEAAYNAGYNAASEK